MNRRATYIHKRIAGSKIGETITADSIPNGDGTWYNSGWGCSEWGLWLEANHKKYGKEVTRKKFIEEWTKQGVWDNQYNFCKYDSSFVSIVERTTGESYGHLLSKLITSSSDIVRNAATGANNLSKLLKYLPLILAGGAAFYFRKDISKLIKGK